VPFCSFRPIDECATECGATSLKGIDISNMQLGPKRCARCEWKHSTRGRFSVRSNFDVADPHSPTCGVNGVSTEEGIWWGVPWEKCCYPDVCFPEQCRGCCIDEDEYRYEGYFGSQDPVAPRNHGPNGYVPPTRHPAGDRVGVNEAWRHVDTQAGVDRLGQGPPEAGRGGCDCCGQPGCGCQAACPGDQPPRPQDTRPAEHDDGPDAGPCTLEAKLVDDCVGPLTARRKTDEECKGYIDLFDECLEKHAAYFGH